MNSNCLCHFASHFSSLWTSKKKYQTPKQISCPTIIMQVPPRWIDIWAGDSCFSCFSFHNYPLLNIISNGTRPCRRLFRILFFCISRIYYLAINCFGHRRSMMLQLFWFFLATFRRHNIFLYHWLTQFLWLIYLVTQLHIIYYFHNIFYDGSHAREFCTVFFNGLLNKLATAAVLQSNGKRIQMRSQPLMAGHL